MHGTGMPRMLLAILAVYVALALGYAVATPLWLNVDEPAHYNYVSEIVLGRGLPVVHGAADYDLTSLGQMVRSNFRGNPDVSRLRFESFQPPLYYLIGAALVMVAPGGVWQQVIVLRLLNVALGACVLGVVFLIATRLFPDRDDVAAGATALLAFIPGHVAMTAQPRNDVLAELLLALVVLVCLMRLDGLADRQFVLAGGVLLGLGIVTRFSVYVAPLMLLMADVGYRRMQKSLSARRVLVTLTGVIVVGLAVGGWWFVRNVLTYGGTDILGTGAREVLASGEVQTVFDLNALRFLVVFTYKSFWGVFGWMGVQLDGRVYLLLGILSAMVAVGFAVYLRRRTASLTHQQRWGLAILGLQLLLMIGELIWYNLDLRQPLGRFLYQAAPAIAVLGYLGLRQICALPALAGVVSVAGCLLYFAAGSGLRFLALGAMLAAAFIGLRLLSPRQQTRVLLIVCLGLLVALNVWCIAGVIPRAFG